MAESGKTGSEKQPQNSLAFSYTVDNTHMEEENKLLKETVSQLKNELERYRRPPLMVCEIKEMMENGKNAIIRVPNGNEFYVEVSNSFRGASGDAVLVEQKNLTVIEKITGSFKFNVEKYVIIEKPTITWKQIGGLSREINEVVEVVELPLKKPELFKKVGIQPPKGILLHGPPGTGKTLLAKAVAASTNSTFIQVVGSELVQKFIGEGARLVNEIFQLARAKAPAIIFIDEVDALAARRVDMGTSGEREVQRTFMQLLAEIDGFMPLDNVKIVGCTNRMDILDPAILRPGRLDRIIFVDIPDEDGRMEIFKIHSANMTLDKNIDLKKVIKNMEGFSGAEIRAACTEAGYFAIRKDRTKIFEKDLLEAIEKVKDSELEEGKDYLNMFG